MKEQHFKFTTLSFILINIWTLYGFFDYFTEEPGMFHSLGLFFFFGNSILCALGVGLLLILLRVSFFRKSRKDKLRNNFFYLFTGIFNFYLFIIWLICLFVKKIQFDNNLSYFILGDLLISIILFCDIYYKKRMHKNEVVMRQTMTRA